MRLEEIQDPQVRAAAERLVRDTGKPLHTWLMSSDEPVLRKLLVRRHYLVDDALAPAKPFDADLLEIRLALRGLSMVQRKGLANGDPVMIEVAAEMVMEHLQLSGIKLQRQAASSLFSERPPRSAC